MDCAATTTKMWKRRGDKTVLGDAGKASEKWCLARVG